MSSEALEESEGFYRDFYEHAPDLVCSVDLETGAIASCNQTFADELGYTKDELVGRDALEFYSEASRPVIREVHDRLLEGDEVGHVEAQIERADGSVFDVSLAATSIRQEGEVVGTRTVLRDITELKEAQRDLAERARRLERSNEELEQFAYLASHDLQEPLRMVASYTQLLERRYSGELDQRAQKYIEYAVEGAERMKALLEDLLEYSRLGRPQREREPVDLGEVLETVCANLRVRIAESDAEVEWDELPAVSGDESQLVQLFQNLVENGIKFQDTGTPIIRLAAESAGDHHRIGVSDNGIGIDTENADRMFQIFQRLHERGAYPGTGAGLAIVKKLVDAHDGEIDVESSLGEGTTFYVTLPAAQRGEKRDG